MSSDIKLDAEGDGWVTVESDVLKARSSDFMLDCGPRRRSQEGYRRALVHNEDDGLTVNCDGDYPGDVLVDSAVTIQGNGVIRGDCRINGDARIDGAVRLTPIESEGGALPRKGNIGDLVVVQNVAASVASEVNDVSLWICIGPGIGFAGGDQVYWQRLSAGEAVAGTLD